MLERAAGDSREKETKDLVILKDGLDREEIILLLTMHYIERAGQGENPPLEEYTANYPELAAELKTNIAHYWLETRVTLEEFKQEDASVEYQAQIIARLRDPQEQTRSRQAVTKILAGITPQVKTEPPEENLQSLYQRAREKKLTPPQLARKTGITSDIMMALEQRMVNLTGIPRQIFERLSEVLEVSNRQLVNYFGGAVQASAMYHADDKPVEAKRQEFADYIRQSQMLKQNEKEYWLHEVENDALTEN